MGSGLYSLRMVLESPGEGIRIWRRAVKAFHAAIPAGGVPLSPAVQTIVTLKNLLPHSVKSPVFGPEPAETTLSTKGNTPGKGEVLSPAQTANF